MGLSNLTQISVGVSTTTISGQSPPFGTNDGEAAALTRRNRAVVDVAPKPQDNALTLERTNGIACSGTGFAS